MCIRDRDITRVEFSQQDMFQKWSPKNMILCPPFFERGAISVKSKTLNRYSDQTNPNCIYSVEEIRPNLFPFQTLPMNVTLSQVPKKLSKWRDPNIRNFLRHTSSKYLSSQSNFVRMLRRFGIPLPSLSTHKKKYIEIVWAFTIFSRHMIPK